MQAVTLVSLHATDEAALAAVRAEIETHGEDPALTLALAQVDTDGVSLVPIADGFELVELGYEAIQAPPAKSATSDFAGRRKATRTRLAQI